MLSPPLPHRCHFETRPSPLSKIGGNAFGAHFLKLYHKNEHGDPNFLFHGFNKNFASFQREKNWHKSAECVQFFSYFTKFYGLSYNESKSACPN